MHLELTWFIRSSLLFLELHQFCFDVIARLGDILCCSCWCWTLQLPCWLRLLEHECGGGYELRLILGDLTFMSNYWVLLLECSLTCLAVQRTSSSWIWLWNKYRSRSQHWAQLLLALWSRCTRKWYFEWYRLLSLVSYLDVLDSFVLFFAREVILNRRFWIWPFRRMVAMPKTRTLWFLGKAQKHTLAWIILDPKVLIKFNLLPVNVV